MSVKTDDATKARINAAMKNAPPGLFVTGTDTGVGKTYIAVLIAKSLRSLGLQVGVYKPLASGCRVEGDRRICDDAVQLWQAAGCPATLSDVCPQAFVAPLAPHLAARAEGKTIDRSRIAEQWHFWQKRSEIVVVEGAGGLLSPISENAYVADLAREFGYPLLLVAANRIGVINQVLCTLAAAEKCDPPLAVAGIILNHVTAAGDSSAISNRAELAARTVVPVLADVGFGADALPQSIDWMELARIIHEPSAAKS